MIVNEFDDSHFSFKRFVSIVACVIHHGNYLYAVQGRYDNSTRWEQNEYIPQQNL